MPQREVLQKRPGMGRPAGCWRGSAPAKRAPVRPRGVWASLRECAAAGEAGRALRAHEARCCGGERV